MTTTTEPQVQDVLAGEKIPVGVGEIDKELVTLWQATAQTPTGMEERQAVTLVRVLNLLTYVEGDDRADGVNEVIRRITGRHPCRSILMVCKDGDGPAGTINAWISAHCQMPNASGKQICTEQITIAAEGAAVKTMHTLALHLLVTDVPTFLWWTASQPFEDHLLTYLSPSIDRLIVDSAVFKTPVESLIKMAELGGAHQLGSRHRAMSDFNWTRLSAWHQAAAEFFDPPAMRPYLDGVARVEIEYTAAPGGGVNPVQALLYAGWLASRLDWQFEGAEQGDNKTFFVLRLRHGTHPVMMRITPVPAGNSAPGGIHVVRLLATRPGQARFDITRDAVAQCLTTRVSLGGIEPTMRTTISVEPEEAELLDRELEMFEHDRVYEQALDMASLFAQGSAPAQRWSIVA